MRKALLVLFLLAGPALGQATMTTNITAAENTALTAERPVWNAAVCASMGVLSGCTQSAARSAFCVKVGLASNCTYAAAKDAYCAQNSAFADYPCLNVPVVVIAGTNEELFNAKAQQGLDTLRANQRETQAASFCGAGGIWRSMTRAQKDTVCASLTPAQPAGCQLCK